MPNGMSTFVLAARGLMVMEYLEYGDLRGLIERQTEHYLTTGDYRHPPRPFALELFSLSCSLLRGARLDSQVGRRCFSRGSGDGWMVPRPAASARLEASVGA